MTIVRFIAGATGGLFVAGVALVVLTFVCSVPVLGFLACFGLPAPPAWEVLAMLAGGALMGGASFASKN